MKNQYFNFRRFGLLLKRELYLHGKDHLISLSGAFGIMLIITTIVALTMRRNDFFIPYGTLLLIFYTGFGILFLSNAFQYFRNRIRTVEYLMIPGSHTEKFVFEILWRILFFNISFVILYWSSLHISIGIANWLHPRDLILTVNIPRTISVMFNVGPEIKKLMIITVLTGINLGQILFFTGASFFTKFPLVKTASVIIIIILGFSFVGYILNQIIHYTETAPRDSVHDIKDTTVLYLFMGFFVFNILLFLTITFLRLKEKEA